MKYIVLLFIFFSALNCEAQDSSKQIIFPEVGWTLTVDPSKFADPSQFNSIAQKANQAINDTYNSNVDLAKDVHPLFTIIDGNYNLFSSTINLFDSSISNDWRESYAMSKKMVLDLINSQAPQMKLLDTLSGYEIIDGLRFELLQIKTFYPNRNLTMTTYWFYRKQNQYDFSINIACTDDDKFKMFLDILKESKFSH